MCEYIRRPQPAAGGARQRTPSKRKTTFQEEDDGKPSVLHHLSPRGQLLGILLTPFRKGC